MMMVTPINDLQSWEPGSMVKGERLMRCKLASVHRLFDLYGWAQISRTCLTVSFTTFLRHIPERDCLSNGMLCICISFILVHAEIALRKYVLGRTTSS